jgi:hypothetical protein
MSSDVGAQVIFGGTDDDGVLGFVVDSLYSYM